MGVATPLVQAAKITVNEPAKANGQVTAVPVAAKATTPVEGSLVRTSAQGQRELGWIVDVGLELERLGLEVGGQADCGGEAVAPGVQSQGQAKNTKELAVVTGGVGEEFVIHEEEYTSGLMGCKQKFSRIFSVRFRCAWH